MAMFQRTRNVLRNNFNIRKWSDYDRIQADSRSLGSYIKYLFRVQRKTHTETFEQAKARMNLSDQALKERQSALFRLACIMVAVASVVFIYCIYSVLNQAYTASIMTFMITLVALTLAFRYHFCYF